MPLTGKEMLRKAKKDGWELLKVRGSHHHVRKNVSIPEWLAKRAKAEGLNVSQVLTEALEERLS